MLPTQLAFVIQYRRPRSPLSQTGSSAAPLAGSARAPIASDKPGTMTTAASADTFSGLFGGNESGRPDLDALFERMSVHTDNADRHMDALLQHMLDNSVAMATQHPDARLSSSEIIAGQVRPAEFRRLSKMVTQVGRGHGVFNAGSS